MKKFLIAFALAAHLGGAAHAASFTDWVGFGDSLSDKGRIPSFLLAPPSNDGRFTDGETWMEQVGEAFENRGGANINMSLGGATAGPLNDNAPLYALGDFANGPRDPSDPDDIPLTNLGTFADQITAFFNAGFFDTLGSNPLVGVLMGPNDLLQANATTLADALLVIDTVTNDVIDGIRTIYNTNNGLDDFFLANAPDVTLGPLATGQTPGEIAFASQGVQLFNTTLATKALLLQTEIPVSIQVFDFATSFENAINDGIQLSKIVDEACIPTLTTTDLAVVANSNCLFPGTSKAFLFADNVHPNGFIHDRIGSDALAQLSGQIAPVPLPASLSFVLLGLGGFLVLGRRNPRRT